MTKNSEEVIAELDISREEYEIYSRLANEADQTIEEFINDAITNFLSETSGELEENCGL